MTFKKILSSILDLFFPRKVAVEKLEGLSAHEFRALCPKSEQTSWIHALFSYRSQLAKNAIWEIKYRGNDRIIALLAELLYEEIVEELSEKLLVEHFSKPVLVPIPLSRKRQRDRGFNQCTLLAHKLATIDKNNFFEVAPLLEKMKETESQTKSASRAARLENLRGCFRALPEARGRNIILIDDVTTTGATLEEARKTLTAAGAKRVIAFAIAH